MKQLLLGFCLVCLGVSASANNDADISMKEILADGAAQEAELLEAESQQHIARDEFLRDTPRSSVLGFLRVSREGDFEEATLYMDFRNLPKDVKKIPEEKLAKQLKVVLDRTLWIDLESLSTEEGGHKDDNLPSYRDRIGVIKANEDHKNIDILYQRVPGPEGDYIWKFSNRTVAEIPELYKLHGFNKIEEYLAEHSPEFKVLGIDGWLWFIVISTLILSYFVIAKPVCIVLLYLISKTKPVIFDHIKSFVNGPLQLMLMLYIAHFFLNDFHFTVEAQAVIRAGTLRIIIHTWFFVKVVGLVKEYWAYKLNRDDKKDAVVLLRPLATVLKILIVVSAALLWLSNVGYNITTLVAGLGIGGLAVALAAQRSLENLLATIIIYATSPIKAGDYCLVGGIRGKIEEVGLWATRIRTFERSVVFIPNSQLSAGIIENFSMRDKYNFSRILYLSHETSKEKIEEVMEKVVEVLSNHDKTDEKMRRVHLESIGEFGFEVNIKSFINTTDMSENKQAIAEINLAINQAVQDAGVTYAKPLKPSAAGGAAPTP